MACEHPLPDGRELAFSIEDGGLVCLACGPQLRPLTGPEYGILALYHHPDWTLLEELSEPDGDERRVQALVHSFVAYHAEVLPPPDLRAG
jgi:hypothetical protein